MNYDPMYDPMTDTSVPQRAKDVLRGCRNDKEKLREALFATEVEHRGLRQELEETRLAISPKFVTREAFEEVTAENNELREQRDVAVADRDRAETEVERLRAALEKQDEDWDAAEGGLLAENERLRYERDIARAENAEWAEAITAHDGEVAKLREGKDRNGRRWVTAMAGLAELQGQLGEARDKVESLRDEIRWHKTVIEVLTER